MRPRYQLSDPAFRGMLLCNRWGQLRTVTGQVEPPAAYPSTYADASAVPLIADRVDARAMAVGLAPLSDPSTCSNVRTRNLFDHLVGAGEQRRRNRKAEC